MEKMKYTFGKSTKMTYDEALAKLPDLLKEEGFGVLTEIDVKETMKKKLDVGFRKYKILGACNPKLAYQAFQAEIEIGALLPCNVIVYEDDSGKAVVSFMDPLMALGFIGNESLSGVAKEANDRLRRVLDKI
ncbi:MAG: DUF302 domain-containing protein [Candidatus Zixiibacteriota bacterium]